MRIKKITKVYEFGLAQRSRISTHNCVASQVDHLKLLQLIVVESASIHSDAIFVWLKCNKPKIWIFLKYLSNSSANRMLIIFALFGDTGRDEGKSLSLSKFHSSGKERKRWEKEFVGNRERKTGKFSVKSTWKLHCEKDKQNFAWEDFPPSFFIFVKRWKYYFSELHHMRIVCEMSTTLYVSLLFFCQ